MPKISTLRPSLRAAANAVRSLKWESNYLY